MCVQHCSLTHGFNVTRNTGNERVYNKTEVPLFYYIYAVPRVSKGLSMYAFFKMKA